MNTDLIQRATSDPPDFHHTNLCRYRDWAATDKYVLDQSETNIAAEIDVSRVVGHDQGYGEMTWAYMLQNLKRIDRRLKELASNSDYYLSHENKRDWVFIEVDDKIFISTGKHRTTILRYLAHYNPEHFPQGPIARGVTVHKRYRDHQISDLVTDIHRKIVGYPHLSFKYIGIHSGEMRWHLINANQNFVSTLTRAQLAEFHHDLSESNFFKRVIGRGYHRILR